MWSAEGMSTVLILSAVLLAAEGHGVAVSETFNGAAFDYGMELRARRAGYRVYRLTYPSPVVTAHRPNNTVPADYYLPDGLQAAGPRRPAVICTHLLDGDFELAEMICTVLALRGLPAMMIKLPYYGERELPEGPEALAAGPNRFVAALDQASQDMRRTIDLLASRPEVDPRLIGITGISLGGIVAATTAAEEPRINRAVLLLAGGDLTQVIHHARETQLLSKLIKRLPPKQRAEVEAKIAAVDPLNMASRLCARARRHKVLMINAAEDEVIPRACSEKLAEALGIADHVIWLEGLGHYSAIAELPRALKTTADFFAEDLSKELAIERPLAREEAFQSLVSLIAGAAEMLGTEPARGRCHVVDLEVSATLEGKETLEAQMRLIRGGGRKFRLRAKLPTLGEIDLGQCDYPWLTSGEEALIVGTVQSGTGQSGTGQSGTGLRDLWSIAGSQDALKVRMAAGALGGVAMAPDVLRRWIAVENASSDGGLPAIRPAIRIVLKHPLQGSVRLVFNGDGKTPELAEFNIEGAKGLVKFRQWQLGAVARDEMFEPPGELPRQEMDRAAVYLMFSTMAKLLQQIK